MINYNELFQPYIEPLIVILKLLLVVSAAMELKAVKEENAEEDDDDVPGRDSDNLQQIKKLNNLRRRELKFNLF